jgi:hypothetical protein
MRKKFYCLFICFILFSTTFSIIVPAGDQSDPEIVDSTGDINISFLDIESVWFFENEVEPDYLFISLKIKDLKEGFNAVFSVRWTYNDVVYVSGLDTFYFKDNEFRSGLRQRATYWQWKSMPECVGIFDENSDIITWKILKSDIGNPKNGDVLTHTEASAVTGFPYNLFYIFTGNNYRDFAPDNYGDYGKNYVVKF